MVESGINGKTDRPGYWGGGGLVHETLKQFPAETPDISGVNSQEISVH